MLKQMIAATGMVMLAGQVMAAQLPGQYSNMCLSKLSQIGSKQIAVYDGNWSGLPQTALIASSADRGHMVMLVATPGKAAWHVAAGCQKYSGTLENGVFQVENGQTGGEKITYTISSRQLQGKLVAPGISNHATLIYQGTIHLD
jgi:hypothetical protein